EASCHTDLISPNTSECSIDGFMLPLVALSSDIDYWIKKIVGRGPAMSVVSQALRAWVVRTARYAVLFGIRSWIAVWLCLQFVSPSAGANGYSVQISDNPYTANIYQTPREACSALAPTNVKYIFLNFSTNKPVLPVQFIDSGSNADSAICYI